MEPGIGEHLEQAGRHAGCAPQVSVTGGSWYVLLPVDENGKPIQNGVPLVEVEPGVWASSDTVALQKMLADYFGKRLS